MLDVWLPPTTDGRWLVMPRYTQPEAEQAILLHKLQLRLPQQPPPHQAPTPIPISRSAPVCGADFLVRLRKTKGLTLFSILIGKVRLVPFLRLLGINSASAIFSGCVIRILDEHIDFRKSGIMNKPFRDCHLQPVHEQGCSSSPLPFRTQTMAPVPVPQEG